MTVSANILDERTINVSKETKEGFEVEVNTVDEHRFKKRDTDFYVFVRGKTKLKAYIKVDVD